MSLLLTCLLSGALSFSAVFLKTFQALSIQHRRYHLIVPTSYGLSLSDLFLGAVVAKTYITLGVTATVVVALSVGTANWVGCILAMVSHEWITKKIYKWDKKGNKKVSCQKSLDNPN
jgi:hypothetical protein